MREVGLIVDRVDEVARVADRIVSGASSGGCAMHAREADQDRLVALDLAAHAGAQDLDRDLVAVLEARAVDLRDARGGDRLLVELAEQLGERLAEVGLDRPS